jgi:ABC-type bacteriocin/lantibiotic exporter with double-glycine peptidase domain
MGNHQILKTLRGSMFHLVATVVWVLLVIPTMLWWRQSVFWIAVMSLYANVVGHWAAYQAARAEETATKND